MASKIRMSKERYDELVKAERMLNDLLPVYDKLEECGVDCTGFRQINAERLPQIAAMKKNFGPNAQ